MLSFHKKSHFEMSEHKNYDLDHGYLLKRTQAGNTIFSILEKKNRLISVLSFVLDEAYNYNGILITNKNRIEKYSKKTKMNTKAFYSYIKELVDLKILIKESIGEYKVNTNVIDYLEKDANIN